MDRNNRSKTFPPMKRAAKSLGGEAEIVDLDVTPVMNLFMVIIPFLVSMAVFTHIAVIDFSLPQAQADGSGVTESKELDISIVISRHGFRIVGTGKQLDLVPLDRGTYQFETLRQVLKTVKFQYPSQRSIVLVLEPDVLYDDIVKFMDSCREAQFPDIGLSGDIG